MASNGPDDRFNDNDDKASGQPLGRWRQRIMFAQATGVVMELFHCSPEDAARRLEVTARRTGVPLDVVVKVVRGLPVR